VTYRCDTAAERLLHAAFLATILYRFGPADAVAFRARPARAILNGQCVALPRERFLAAGGYGRVRANMTEDSALARSLAGAGWRVGFVHAGALVEVRMYESARETWDGWGRSIASPDATPAAWQALDVATLWLAVGLPPLKLLARRATWVDALLLATRLALGRQIARAYHPRGVPPLLSVVADPAVVARFTWSVLRPTRTWRGRTYR
jgi:dolichol-phosphate mannosyltransferase